MTLLPPTLSLLIEVDPFSLGPLEGAGSAQRGGSLVPRGHVTPPQPH